MRNKNYEQKKKKIIDTAAGLFLKKGYEKTSVDEIIKKADISKGTFYHYFVNKRSILELIVDEITERQIEEVTKIVNNNTTTPLEKLNTYFKINRMIKKNNHPLMFSILSLWNNDANCLLRITMQKNLTHHITPLLAQIFEQGIRQGLFVINDTYEAGLLMINLRFILRDRIIKGLTTGEIDRTRLKNMVVSYQTFVEKMIEAPRGSLKIYDQDTFKLVENITKQQKNNPDG